MAGAAVATGLSQARRSDSYSDSGVGTAVGAESVRWLATSVAAR
jgi:hypothetical protein